MSGCFSPSRSAIWACCRWRSDELRLELLDERVRQDGRERIEGHPVGLDGLELPVDGLLLDSVGPRLGHRGIQVREPLHDDVLPVLEGDGVALLAVALQGLLGLFDLLPLFPQLLAEPVRGLLGREELELEVLLDILAGEGVGDLGRDGRILRLETQINQAAVSDGRDGEAPEQGVDQARLRGGLVGRRD